MAVDVMPPSGTVTFLFTDVEGSTRLWEREPDEMRVALEGHDAIVRSEIERRGGYVFSTAGDSFAAAFGRAGDAVAAATAIQDALGANQWPTSTPIRVRVGLHAGSAQERDGDYFGADVGRAARIMGAAHGGQTLASELVASLANVDDSLELGAHQLKDVTEPLPLLQLGSGRFPPIRAVSQLGAGLAGFATSLMARDRDATVVDGLVEEYRVVTLTGPGGVGKTRLAVEAALQAMGRFSDGARLVELAPVTDEPSIHQAVAMAVGAPQLNGRTLLERTVQRLQGRQLLMVIDNCEHLVDEAASVIDYLASRSPGIRSWLRVVNGWLFRASRSTRSSRCLSPQREVG